MKYYAVLDTNVLISSLLTQKTDTATALVINAVAEGDIIPLYNEDIIGEYEEVLKRDKFAFSEGKINRILHMIRQFGLSIIPTPTGEILPDMDDLIFYEVVMEKREDDAYLVTGNIRHFPTRDYIVTPAEMMDIINADKDSTGSEESQAVHADDENSAE